MKGTKFWSLVLGAMVSLMSITAIFIVNEPAGADDKVITNFHVIKKQEQLGTTNMISMVVRDTETGAEYIIIRNEREGIAITPRIDLNGKYIIKRADEGKK